MFSSRFSPQQIPFDGQTIVRLEVPVATGHNDITIELVEPKPVERADDPKARMLQVSKIEVWPIGAASLLGLSH